MALTDSLVSVWELDEVSGDALDSYGSNNLTEQGGPIASVTAKSGNGRDFEVNNSQYFSKTDNASLSAGDIEFTISCWVKLESLASTMIIASKAADVASATFSEYSLYYSTFSNRFVFRVSTGSVSTVVNADVLGVASTDTWYWVIGKHNPVTNQISIKVNNGTANTASHSGGIVDGGNNFYIGRDGTGRFMDGVLDQLVIWKRLTTDDEDATIYNSGNALPYSSWAGGSSEYNETGFGGALAGGSADHYAIVSPTASGGAVLSGSGDVATILAESASGGAVLGGSADVGTTGTYDEVASGGLTAGGSADHYAIVSPTASGGAVLAGSGDTFAILAESASGGVVLGGSASIGTSATYDETGSGGAVSGSSGNVSTNFNQSTSGGVNLSGNATPTNEIMITTQGGLVSSGLALVARVLSQSGEGGIAIGSSGIVQSVVTQSLSGGVLLGGSGSIDSSTERDDVVADIVATLNAAPTSDFVTLQGMVSQVWADLVPEDTQFPYIIVSTDGESWLSENTSGDLVLETNVIFECFTDTRKQSIDILQQLWKACNRHEFTLNKRSFLHMMFSSREINRIDQWWTGRLEVTVQSGKSFTATPIDGVIEITDPTTDLVNTLSGISAVTDLVNGVYADVIEEDTAFPYLVVSTMGEVLTGENTEGTITTEFLVQIETWGTERDDVVDVIELVFWSLHRNDMGPNHLYTQLHNRFFRVIDKHWQGVLQLSLQIVREKFTT